jgi:hypothetical protein
MRAKKMTRGKVEPLAIPTMVKVVPLVVQVIKQIALVSHMTFP